MQVTNRQDRYGGGIGLIYRSQYNPQLIDKGVKTSFERGVWPITHKKTSLHIVLIYHTLNSQTNQATNSTFMDEFKDFMVKILSKHKSSIILGDLNIYVNDYDENEAMVFSDMMTVVRFRFYTHKNGNILNLIYTENWNEPDVIGCSPGPFILDHSAVTLTLGLGAKRLSK